MNCLFPRSISAQYYHGSKISCFFLIAVMRLHIIQVMGISEVMIQKMILN